MSDVAEKCKSAQELQDDLLAIKLRLAFQEDLEEEIEALSHEPCTDPQVLSAMDGADARILKRIHRAVRRKNRSHWAHVTVPRVAKALAACLLVSFIGLTTAMAAVPAVRTHVLRFIMKMEKEYTTLSFEYGDMDVDVPEGWSGRYYMAYIPSGFVYDKDSFSDEATYRNPDGDMLLFSEHGSSTRVNIDTEDADVRFVDIQGQNALLCEKGGWVTLTWAMSDRFFIVDLQGSVEEALRIAENVVPIE